LWNLPKILGKVKNTTFRKISNKKSAN
jgi:hypothetical protein